jgi:GGDEF domain-containing protein
MWEHRESVSAVVFSIERMAGINARFGCITADELLRNLSRHLTASLGPADQLYRWRGPHLMALIQRDIASASPSMEIARIAEWGSEHAVTVRDREVTVSASVAWDLFPLDVFAGVEDLLASINGFAVGNQLPPGQASRNSAIAELAVLDSK